MPWLTVTVHFNCHRPVVGESDFHHFAKLPVCNIFCPVKLSNLVGKSFIEHLRWPGAHAVVKIGLVTFQHGIERELTSITWNLLSFTLELQDFDES